MSESPYEVRCHHCDVSFPVGTKTCLHCGERVGGGPFFRIGTDPTESVFEQEPVFGEAEAAEEPDAPRRPFRFGVTMIWLAALVLSAAQRACQGN